ncbi:hypothetical protein I553_5337 [Mycobacterium xenopi 4042]|uniref:Uncharacterized protein n=1 Tax=Mycobacterium xenopi 4042 TaxID=1299334 RepID=X7ZXI0_MYCXE|nr:hypothetical protein I553_5337 [Mycobacterium xenopi 4042]
MPPSAPRLGRAGAHHREHSTTGGHDRAVVAPGRPGVQYALGLRADDYVAEPWPPG